ncbi:uncharacterized protein LOC105692155 isoform X2 [Athalia rosae]|uniref:uncharacterized protein LOC105692155 isoform X2 n=1 Tax=Athalia rosae TaxID=37344 RepID=UPI002033C724|nr:uncharacterized protein LOC105692155 isoform X2 [Athalia rosae]
MRSDLMPTLFNDREFVGRYLVSALSRSSEMQYPIILIAATLFASLVVSETLRNDVMFSNPSDNEAIRQRRGVNQPAAVQPTVENINYRPFSHVPESIKQLLVLQQAREPITHIPAQPPPQLAKTPTVPKAQYNAQVQYAGQPQTQGHSQVAYQPQQAPQYQRNHHQVQGAYNPQQLQQFRGAGDGHPPNSAVRTQQQVFHPAQGRHY